MQQTNSLDSTVSSFLYTLPSAAGDYLSCLRISIPLSHAAVCLCESVQEGSDMYCVQHAINIDKRHASRTADVNNNWICLQVWRTVTLLLFPLKAESVTIFQFEAIRIARQITLIPKRWRGENSVQFFLWNNLRKFSKRFSIVVFYDV